MTFIGVNTNWTYPIENRIIYITKFDVEYCLIINTHNVEVTIVNNLGQEITGETWPLTMEVDSTGRYAATLPDDLGIANHKHYVATIVATSQGGIVRTFKRQLIAKYDT